jgi:hypothetical protein
MVQSFLRIGMGLAMSRIRWLGLAAVGVVIALVLTRGERGVTTIPIAETPTERRVTLVPENTSTRARLEAVFLDMDAVQAIEMVTVRGTLVHAELIVLDGMVTLETAEALAEATIDIMETAPEFMSFILWDGSVAKDFTWQARTDRWTETSVRRAGEKR